MLKKIIDDLKKEINLITDIGLDIEMKDILKNDKNIEKFEINSEENKQYIINIKVKEFNKNRINNLFIELFTFIKYSDINFYTRSIIEDKIIYEFISAKENMTGYYCNIIFEKQ